MNQTESKIIDLKDESEGMHLAVCTPAYQHNVSVDYMSSTLSLFVSVMQSSQNLKITHHVVSNIASASKNRNALISNAISAGADVILMIDNDIGYHASTVKFMLDRIGEEHPMIAALPQTNVPIEGKKGFGVNMLPDQTEHKIIDGLMEVRDVPTAFMMLHVPTVKKLMEQHPELQYWAHGIEGANEHLYALFDYLVVDAPPDDPDGDAPARPTGRYTGEDYGFCHYWREAGFPIYVAPEITLRHVKIMKLDGRWMDDLAPYARKDEGSEDAEGLDEQPVGTSEPEPGDS